MKHTVITLVTFIFALSVQAQKFEGTITYGLEYSDLPAEMAAMEAMLPDEMLIQIKGDETRLEQSMGMGMSVVTITNMKKESGTLLMDMMGQKMAVDMSKANFEEMKKDKTSGKPEFKYIDGEGREIAGYSCKKAIVVSKNAGELVVYYTEDLPAGASKTFEGLKGFPLEYSAKQGQFSVKMTAKSIDKEKLDVALFSVPDDFNKISFVEFQKVMGGMMGGG